MAGTRVRFAGASTRLVPAIHALVMAGLVPAIHAFYIPAFYLQRRVKTRCC
jgi:hypothetical protein